MTTDLKQFISEQLQGLTKMYVQDLQATPHEQLGYSPGGKARTAYDVTYEVIVVNNRIASGLRGEDPGPWPGGEHLRAPAEFCNKERIVRELEGSIDAVLTTMRPACLVKPSSIGAGCRAPQNMMPISDSYPRVWLFSTSGGRAFRHNAGESAVSCMRATGSTPS